MGELFHLLWILLAGAVGLGLFVFWVWMLVHAITNQRLRDLEKVIWVLVIIFTQLIGALIYFFIGRPKAG